MWMNAADPTKLPAVSNPEFPTVVKQQKDMWQGILLNFVT